jgi:hypothetical protein
VYPTIRQEGKSLVSPDIRKMHRINDKAVRYPSKSLHKTQMFMIGCKVNERRFSFSTHRLLSKKKLQSHKRENKREGTHIVGRIPSASNKISIVIFL